MTATFPRLAHLTHKYMTATFPRLAHLTHKYMTATFPRLAHLTHKYMTATFPRLAHLTHKYMTATFPGLVQAMKSAGLWTSHCRKLMRSRKCFHHVSKICPEHVDSISKCI
jgi:hypothetical protein